MSAPYRQLPLVEPLRKLLEAHGVSELRLVAFRRPGERRYWVAYAYVGAIRHVVATPDLRHLPLAAQAQQLVARVRAWLEGEVPPLHETGSCIHTYGDHEGRVG